jgi:DNA-binding CsgD family transcriptional regulator
MCDHERHDEALAQANRALEIYESLGYALGLAWVKRAMGLMHYERGERSLARRLLEASLADARRQEGLGWWVADSLACVAQLDIDSHRFDRASMLLKEALEVSMTLGDRRMVARCLERLAYLAAARGRTRRAVWLAAAATSLRTATGLPRAPVESKAFEHWLEPAELALEPAARDQLCREAAAMTLESILTYALEAKPSENADVPVVSPSERVLTTREREVSVLVSHGLSNQDIASRLVISERTVESHVSNALAKLGLPSRAGLAGWAARQAGSHSSPHYSSAP